MPPIKTLILAFPFLFVSPDADKPSWYISDVKDEQRDTMFHHTMISKDVTVEDMHVILTHFADAQRWKQFRRICEAFHKVNPDKKLSWSEVGQEMDKFEEWALNEMAQNEKKAKQEEEEAQILDLGFEI